MVLSSAAFLMASRLLVAVSSGMVVSRKIDGVKFRQKVVPGDTLLFRVELLAPIRRGISTMKGYAFVGEKVVCEAEFMAQIVKNK